MMPSARGAGENVRCVLLVEDEMCLAMMLQDILEDAGFRVIKAARVPGALALAEAESIDVAILDVNIAGKEVFPVATELRARGVPFMFASGYGERGLPEEFRDCPVLQKPYDLAALETMLERVLASGDVQAS